MESRVKKYYMDDIQVENASSTLTRSSRNAKLYKNIYSDYEESDNLPIEDNTDEIDMERLKELVLNNSKKEENKIKENLNILEQRKRQIDEQKIYDINKIIEKAKYENNKLKQTTSTITKPRKDILSTLESTELSLEEINEAKKKYQNKLNSIDEEIKKETELSMTRELKYKNLNTNDLQENTKNIIDTNSLSLDLFEDLRPTENTIKTEPIKAELNHSEIKSDIHSGDTRDIDIIKSSPSVSANDFFTNSYEFSEKDFADEEEEDFFDSPQKNGLFKIFLLVLAIIIFIGVIIYFVGTYGLGIL